MEELLIKKEPTGSFLIAGVWRGNNKVLASALEYFYTPPTQELDANEETDMTMVLPPDYRPSEKEEFMNPLQLAYFHQKLTKWRQELLMESHETLQHLQNDSHNEPDITDRASNEVDFSIELRTRDRERKLITKIDEALMRIQNGTYGYCEETGDPITLARLEARPIATLSIEAQEQHEKLERLYRDD